MVNSLSVDGKVLFGIAFGQLLGLGSWWLGLFGRCVFFYLDNNDGL